MDIIKLAKESEERLIEYRRHFHRYPELTGKEFETLKFIRQELEKYDVEYVEIENGGILVTIDSNKPGKTVLLRADIDALPIEECQYNDGGFKKSCISLNIGVAHMCGHDCHTAMLLVALQILNQYKDTFKGKIYGFFERGEESGDNIYYCLKYFKENKIEFDNCFGIHVNSNEEFELGSVIVHPNEYYAGMIVFDISINGKGGHGSRPDLCNNPIDVFADVVNALREIKIDKEEYFRIQFVL
ncbi:MAG: M20 metallopeptidase family protein [Erysipelotrichaceae bacterium]|jgi:amidohydrolase